MAKNKPSSKNVSTLKSTKSRLELQESITEEPTTPESSDKETQVPRMKKHKTGAEPQLDLIVWKSIERQIEENPDRAFTYQKIVKRVDAPVAEIKNIMRELGDDGFIQNVSRIDKQKLDLRRKLQVTELGIMLVNCRRKLEPALVELQDKINMLQLEKNQDEVKKLIEETDHLIKNSISEMA